MNLNRKNIVRVQDIILDERHPRYKGSDSIGNIIYTHIDEPTPINLTQLPSAKPLYTNISHYPVANEIVFLISAPATNYNESGKLLNYYLYPHSIFKDPNHNSLPNALQHDNKFYQGNYFKENQTIRPLRPFEGDLIIEGRFGNSIRFGSTTNLNFHTKTNRWSSKGTVGDPITIIRNGQFNNPTKPNYESIVENISADLSSIYLCSNQQIVEFIPASIHSNSYGHDFFKEKNTKEPDHSKEPFPSENVLEDIPLNSPNPLPAQELQELSELSDFINTDTAYYDISETESQIISITDSVSMPTSYQVPDNIDMNYLNEQIT